MALGTVLQFSLVSATAVQPGLLRSGTGTGAFLLCGSRWLLLAHVR